MSFLKIVFAIAIVLAAGYWLMLMGLPNLIILMLALAVTAGIFGAFRGKGG